MNPGSNILATAGLAALACLTAPRAEASSTVITNVTVIPMNGPLILESQNVLVEGEHIVAMGPELPIPDGATCIDGAGRYLIPGLSDMHAHVQRQEGHRPEDYLAEGVTLVRNMAGEPSHLVFRERVRSGAVPGPLFYTAGPIIAGEPRLSTRHVIPKTADEARRVVRAHHDAGYDYIKVYSLLERPIYDAILDEARKIGIPVVGHVPDSVRLSGAIAAGQSSIEHFYGYFWELEAADSSLGGRWAPRRLFHAVEIDESKLAVVAAETARAGIWNCPTLWRKNNHLTSPLAREAWETPSLRELGERNRMKLVKALHEAGAGLLSGTDDEAYRIHDELALFVKAGLTPYQALRISTVSGAEYLGQLGEFGTIEVGKQANLVLLEENPLVDIGATRSIVGVMMRGIWMPRISPSGSRR